jgi:hypothetical protein
VETKEKKQKTKRKMAEENDVKDTEEKKGSLHIIVHVT